MKENWDFVSMENYAADMGEMSERHRAVSSSHRKRIVDLERLVRMLIAASGGSITVGNAVMANPPDELIVTYDQVNDATIFRARHKSENFKK